MHSFSALFLASALIAASTASAQLDLKPDQDLKDASTNTLPTKIGKDSAKPADAPKKAAKGPTEITAMEATFDQMTNTGVFSKEVVVKDPEFNITCQKLTVLMKTPPSKGAGAPDKKTPAPIGAPAAEPGTEKPKSKSESGMDKAVAEGDVVITQDKLDGEGKPLRYLAKSRKAVYDADTGNMVLSGMPQITQSIGGALNKQITAREESCIITINNDKGTIVADGGRNTTSLLSMQGLDNKPKTTPENP